MFPLLGIEEQHFTTSSKLGRYGSFSMNNMLLRQSMDSKYSGSSGFCPPEHLDNESGEWNDYRQFHVYFELQKGSSIKPCG